MSEIADSAQISFRCHGPCRQDWPTQQRSVGHRQGDFAGCRGADYSIVLPGGEVIEGSQVTWYCHGPCGRGWPTYQKMIGHRKGPGAACKHAGYGVGRAEAAPAPAPPPALATVGQPVGQPVAPQGEDPDEPLGDDGLRVIETDAAAAAEALPAGYTVVPSTTKETLLIPAYFRAMYDAFRQRWGYEGGFNQWILETVDYACYRLGVEIVVNVRPPAGAEEAQPEPSTSEVRHAVH